MSERSIAQVAKAPVPAISQAPSGLLQRQCACGQHALGGECEGCKKKLVLQRYGTGPGMPGIPPIVNQVLQSDGRPLEAATRLSMESGFRHDFSGVRVHTGDLADKSARAVNAQAYAVGRDVVFAANRYSPGTTAGKRLLAHELSHVIQQSAGTASCSLDLNAAEAEANNASDRVLSGLSAGVGRSVPRYLARQAEDEPTSLNASFDMGSKTYQQLLEELGKIQRWLESNPTNSPDRTKLESIQTQIVQTMKRIDKAMGRSAPMGIVDLRPFSKSPEQNDEIAKLNEKIAPPQALPNPPTPTAPAKTESAYEKFTREHAKEIAQLPQWNEHFAQGLGRSPLGGKLGEAWGQMKKDLTSASRAAAFYMGLQAGVPVGAVKDIYDQLKALAILAIKAMILKAKIEADPQKVWSDLKKFAQSLPNKLLQLFDADQLGFAAGQALAEKVDQEFVKKGPFDQGYAMGEIIGTILMEIALLFVGVEEVSAAVKALRATVLGEEVAHGMALASRELKAIVEAGNALKPEVEIAEGTAKEAKTLGDAEKGTTKLQAEGSEAVSKLKVPEALAGCRLGSLTCPIDSPKFRKHVQARPHEEFFGPLDRNMDLEIGKSLRQKENPTVLGGDAMRARFLREVPHGEWSEPFLEEMGRIDRLPPSQKGISFTEVDVNGVERRWPLDNIGEPWQVHHEPPLDCGGTDASHFLKPAPHHVHSEISRWWERLKKLALEEFPPEQRRLITSSEEIEALGL